MPMPMPMPVPYRMMNSPKNLTWSKVLTSDFGPGIPLNKHHKPPETVDKMCTASASMQPAASG